MKALVCGDLHLKQDLVFPRVEVAAEGAKVDIIVFMGDYVDGLCGGFDSQVEIIAEQSAWVERARAKGLRVIQLMGNHDASYLGGPGTSSMKGWIAEETASALKAMELSAAFAFGGRLITHAGVCREWANRFASGCETAAELAAVLNEMATKPFPETMLASIGRGRGGFSIPGPLWADSSELLADPFPGISQIVAHSPQETCSRFDACRPTSIVGAYAGFGVEGSCGGATADSKDCDLWFCDTHAISPRDWRPVGDGSLLLVDDVDGSASVVHPEEFECEPWSVVAERWVESLRRPGPQ